MGTGIVLMERLRGIVPLLELLNFFSFFFFFFFLFLTYQTVDERKEIWWRKNII